MARGAAPNETKDDQTSPAFYSNDSHRSVFVGVGRGLRRFPSGALIVPVRGTGDGSHFPCSTDSEDSEGENDAEGQLPLLKVKVYSPQFAAATRVFGKYFGRFGRTRTERAEGDGHGHGQPQKRDMGSGSDDTDIRNYFQMKGSAEKEKGPVGAGSAAASNAASGVYEPRLSDIRKVELDRFKPLNAPLKDVYGIDPTIACPPRMASDAASTKTLSTGKRKRDSSVDPDPTEEQQTAADDDEPIDLDAIEEGLEVTRSGVRPVVTNKGSSSSSSRGKGNNAAGPRPPPTNRCAATRCTNNALCLNHLGKDKWLTSKAKEEFVRKRGVAGVYDPDLDYTDEAEAPKPTTTDEAKPTTDETTGAAKASASQVAPSASPPTGIRNLGATCYLNTALQVWFHDRALREGILSVSSSSQKPAAPAADPNPDLPLPAEPASPILAPLQLLFALLLPKPLSPLSHPHIPRSIDPSFLVDALGVDRGTQQDAQEFSKVLAGALEHAAPELGELMQKHLSGELEYKVRCLGCRNVSTRKGNFNEIELALSRAANDSKPTSNNNNNKPSSNKPTDSPSTKPVKKPDGTTLQLALQEYLAKEHLSGDNCYACDTCGRKREAERWTEIGVGKGKGRGLPEVLTFQLLRFVYDLASGSKKKVKSTIRFPEVLDMRPFLWPLPTPLSQQEEERGEADDELIYELQAVLVHRGASAYQGHYIAHAFDEITGKWYKLDDDTVTEMSGTGFKFDVDDEPGTGVVNSGKKGGKGATKKKEKEKEKGGKGAVVDLTGEGEEEVETVGDRDGDADGDADEVAETGTGTGTGTGAEASDGNGKAGSVVSSESQQQVATDNNPPSDQKPTNRTFSSRNAYTLTYVRRSVRKRNQRDPVNPPRVAPDILAQLQVRSDELAAKRVEFARKKREAEGEFEVELEKRKQVWDGWDTRGFVDGDQKKGVFLPAPWLKAWTSGPFAEIKKGAAGKQQPTEKELLAIVDAAEREEMEGVKARAGGGGVAAKEKTTAKEAPLVLDSDPAELMDVDAKEEGPGKDGVSAVETVAVTTLAASDSGPAATTATAVEAVPTTTPPPANTYPLEIPMDSITCPHGKMNVAEVCNSKIIAESSLDLLLELYPDITLPRKLTTSDSLCQVCVDLIREEMKAVADRNEMRETFASLKSEKNSGGESWIVSTSWLRDFNKKSSDWDPLAPMPDPYSGDYRNAIFCQHGRLTPETAQRATVSTKVKNLIQTACTNWRPFPSNEPVCDECGDLQAREHAQLKPLREQAKADNEAFKVLTSPSKVMVRVLPGRRFFFVSNQFLDPFRVYLKRPTASPRPDGIDNSDLVCKDHGLLVWDINDDTDRAEGLKTAFEIVEEDTWVRLVEAFGLFSSSRALRLSRQQAGGPYDTVPGVCEDCRQARIMDWTTAKLVIRKMQAEKPKGGAAGTPIAIEDSEDDDSSNKKRSSKAKGKKVVTGPGPSPSNDTGSRRASTGTRGSKRLQKDEFQVQVGKETTVKDLKVLIMEQNKVSPIYQRLFLESGVELTDNSATMKSLAIVPGQTLELQEFEESDGAIAGLSDDAHHSKKFETGFKGTGLYGFDGVGAGTNGGRAAGASRRASGAVAVEPSESVVAMDVDDEEGMLEEAIRRSMMEGSAPAKETAGTSMDPVNGIGIAGADSLVGKRGSPPADDESEDAAPIGGPRKRSRKSVVKESSEERDLDGEDEVTKGTTGRGSGSRARKQVRSTATAAGAGAKVDLTETSDDEAAAGGGGASRPRRTIITRVSPDLDAPKVVRNIKPPNDRKYRPAHRRDTEEDGGKWTCGVCTYENPEDFLVCEMCRNRRYSDDGL